MEVLVDSYNGKSLAPSDLFVKSDDTIWFMIHLTVLSDYGGYPGEQE